MPSTLPLIGTRAYAGMRLREVLLGPIGISATVAALLVPSVLLAVRDRDTLTISLMAAAAVALWYVAHAFIRENLQNDALPVHSAHPADLLGWELVAEIGEPETAMGGLLRAAASTTRGRFFLREAGLDPDVFLKDCQAAVDASMDIHAFLKAAAEVLPALGEMRVDAPLILALCLGQVDACRDALERAGLPQEELQGLLQWESFHYHFRRRSPSLSVASLRGVSIGRTWVAGYTHALDVLTQEVHYEAAETGEHSVVIHRGKIEAFLRILCRPQRNNALLVGPIGAGKRRMTENALGILQDLQREQNLPFSRVLYLRAEQLLSGTGDPDGAFLHALYKAQNAGRIILVIRDLAMLLKASNARLQTVLLKCLQMGNLSVVGIVDTQDYHGAVKVHPEIDSLFEKIDVEDADDNETMRTLMARAFSQGGPRLTYKAAHAIMELSKRYLSSRGAFPAVALQVYEDAREGARSRGDQTILEADVRGAVSLKAKMNVQAMSDDDRERLLVLERRMTGRIVGQEEAVQAVANALKRARLDLHERQKPLGTFLFLGQTGVGKTLTAKVLAEEYFGSANALIRLDMNEFSHADSVLDVVGSPSSGKGEGFLAQRVQDKPFSLILFDEIEKAHPSVLNLFLQVLDEGVLHDARGVKTDFRNTIIIATSNAGALFIRDAVRKDADADPKALKQALVDHILQQGIFSPEFVNRFDEVILFRPLTPAVVQSIAALMLNDVLGEIRRKRGIEVQIAPELLASLVAAGYSQEFGAREMYRTLLTRVENALADYLLRNDVKRGEKLLLR